METTIIIVVILFFLLSGKKSKSWAKLAGVSDSRAIELELFLKTLKESQYDLYIKQVTRLYRVPEILVMATIFVESRGNPQALGSSGEIGLMQITPICLQDFNEQLNENIQDLFNPFYNIQVGTGYLAILKKRWSSWDNAIVAYNGGNPNNEISKRDYLPQIKEAMRYFG